MITIIQGDITTLAVDAIVNAANERMLGGGGDFLFRDATGLHCGQAQYIPDKDFERLCTH